MATAANNHMFFCRSAESWTGRDGNGLHPRTCTSRKASPPSQSPGLAQTAGPHDTLSGQPWQTRKLPTSASGHKRAFADSVSWTPGGFQPGPFPGPYRLLNVPVSQTGAINFGSVYARVEEWMSENSDWVEDY